MHYIHDIHYMHYNIAYIHIHLAFPKHASILGEFVRKTTSCPSERARVQGMEYHCLETSSRTPR